VQNLTSLIRYFASAPASGTPAGCNVGRKHFFIFFPFRRNGLCKIPARGLIAIEIFFYRITFAGLSTLHTYGMLDYETFFSTHSMFRWNMADTNGTVVFFGDKKKSSFDLRRFNPS